MKNDAAGRLVWAGIFLSLLFFSCGRKALPVAPGAYVPPPVKDLVATFEAGCVDLVWTVPDGQNEKKRGLSKMVVFQTNRAGACPECPLSYEPVATIFAEQMTEKEQGGLEGRSRLMVDGNGPYGFYVVGYSRNDVAGPKSNMTRVASPAVDH